MYPRVWFSVFVFVCEAGAAKGQRSHPCRFVTRSSVYDADAPHVDPGFWAFVEERGIPVLGVCYGVQEMMTAMGGSVVAAEREYGPADLTVNAAGEACPLFAGVTATSRVWMSHSDKVAALPDGFHVVAATPSCSYAAVAHTSRHLFGLQFHPEVSHTAEGRTMLSNFVLGVCKCPATWSMAVRLGCERSCTLLCCHRAYSNPPLSFRSLQTFVDEAIADIRKQVGDTAHVLGAVSGGVDSTVAAVLLNRAIGPRFHALMVDNGLLRKNEATNVLKRLRDECGVDLHMVDASGLFLSRLEGVSDPEAKRKVIGNTFIEVRCECRMVNAR